MKHITLAKELAELYPQRSANQIVIELLQRSLEQLAVRLTPIEGWEGKNQEQRDLAKSRSFLENQEYTELQNALNKTRGDLLTINGKIEALEAEQRELNAKMETTEFYLQDGRIITRAVERLQEIHDELSRLYHRWGELEL